ncbi:cytochrome c oxidase subunit 3 [Pseudochryseolinea flava]|uniref:Cytochrome oxidase subunit III n=1 Tax=Pseudochryseolinea flava TaxID=2059302 RepID=A0A364XWN2_9BACT|nr:cytochrome c oxidase subunit 3 [Pseudochryseolinea flava]RAV98581.1 cytochrome oxidase subunit III [Pseudochryseolinea flava]
MAIDIKIVEEAKKPIAMHPKKFALWLFIATVVMVFAALTSAYIVRQSNGSWLVFDLPNMFWVNTAIILASSLTMHWAYVSAKQDKIDVTKLAITLTTILGTAFLVGQFFAWGQLVDNQIYLRGKDATAVSGSFLYVISWLHWLHVISGVVVLVVSTTSVFRLKANSKNLLGLEMCATYWHFLDVLWLYLFVFLLLNR